MNRTISQLMTYRLLKALKRDSPVKIANHMKFGKEWMYIQKWWMYIYNYIYMYLHIYTYVYKYDYIYTHTLYTVLISIYIYTHNSSIHTQYYHIPTWVSWLPSWNFFMDWPPSKPIGSGSGSQVPMTRSTNRIRTWMRRWEVKVMMDLKFNGGRNLVPPNGWDRWYYSSPDFCNIYHLYAT